MAAPETAEGARELLQGMGYPEAAISLALQHTSGSSAEEAVSWLLDRTPEQLEALQLQVWHTAPLHPAGHHELHQETRLGKSCTLQTEALTHRQ